MVQLVSSLRYLSLTVDTNIRFVSPLVKIVMKTLCLNKSNGFHEGDQTISQQIYYLANTVFKKK